MPSPFQSAGFIAISSFPAPEQNFCARQKAINGSTKSPSQGPVPEKHGFHYQNDQAGKSSAGHSFDTTLPEADKRALIDYLKTFERQPELHANALTIGLRAVNATGFDWSMLVDPDERAEVARLEAQERRPLHLGRLVQAPALKSPCPPRACFGLLVSKAGC